MSLQPLEDRIVVKPGDAEETTVSGLVIPDTAKEKPQQGEVIAVGPGRRRPRDALAASPGPRIVVRRYFFLPVPATTLASTSRLESTSRSSPSTRISVPPYFE